jgi:RNA polymerase sigma-70 factor, ECF subfamily
MHDILFQNIKKGDKKSFEQLFKLYYAPLCLFSHKFIADNDECEEIVQGFFMKLWDKREKIEINTSVKNYLFSSVRNSCFNYLKHKKIHNLYQKQVLQGYEDPQNDYSYFFLEADLYEKIDNAISELPDRRREIFVLSREKGLKYKEIAEQMGLSIKTVEAQMGSALKTLREKLKPYH